MIVKPKHYIFSAMEICVVNTDKQAMRFIDVPDSDPEFTDAISKYIKSSQFLTITSVCGKLACFVASDNVFGVETLAASIPGINIPSSETNFPLFRVFIVVGLDSNGKYISIENVDVRWHDRTGTDELIENYLWVAALIETKIAEAKRRGIKSISLQ